MINKCNHISLLSILFFFVSLVQANAQRTKGVLVFEAENITGYSWEEKLAKKIGEGVDSLTIEKARKEIEAFLARRKDAKKNESPLKPAKWEYHFNKKRARVIGNKIFRGKTFGIYDMKNNFRIVRRYHKENINDFRIDTIDYSLNYRDKEFAFEVFREDSTKIINGFACYKIEIVEKWGHNKEPTMFYEVYVTDEIQFPINALMHIPIKISEACPVSIKHWGLDKRNYFSVQLVQFDKNLEKKMLKVPKEFRRAKK